MPRSQSRLAGSTPPEGDTTAAIRQAIVRLAEQRQQAVADAGRTLASQAELAQAVRNQRGYLTRATREIDAALELASTAADRARTDTLAATAPNDADIEQLAAAAAAPYELTCGALRRQREVISATAGQLEHLDAISAQQIARTRELVRESVRSLDDAIREQLRLLVDLERVERARLIEAARRQSRQRG